MNEKILIIDQEPDVLKALENLLVKKGYEVRSTLRGEEAFDFIKSESFELVIMDIRMQGMDGLEFIKQVKNLDDEIEVIVITGFASIENAVIALRDSGAADFITKPLENIDQLFIAIDKALQKRRMHREVKALVTTLEQANEEIQLRVKELAKKLSDKNTQGVLEGNEHKRA